VGTDDLTGELCAYTLAGDSFSLAATICLSVNLEVAMIGGFNVHDVVVLSHCSNVIP
jgi:hypothetical protein